MSATPNNEFSANPKNGPDSKDNSPNPSEALAIVFDWLRHWWDAPREKSKAADWILVGLTVAIAIAAFWSAWIFQGQLTLADKQWKSQQVPWLGLDESTVSVSPLLKVVAGPPSSKEPVLMVTMTYSVKNFGPSPAFNESDSIMAIAYHDGPKPVEQMRLECEMQDHASLSGAYTFGAGEMILPTNRKQIIDWTTNIQLTPGETHIQRIWLVVCVAYMDSWNKMHHSRYLYLSRHQNVPPVSIPGYPKWTYVPLAGAYLMSAHAD
jgi:hypothetical protein